MTPEEELETLKQFKALIKLIASKHCKDDGIFDDLCIVGEVACLKAIETFDKSKKTKLTTYLYTKIEGAIKDEIKTNYKFFGRKSNDNPIPLSDVESTLSYEIEDLLSNRNDNEKLRKLLEKLSEKEKKILRFRYWEDMKFSEIAKKMNLKEARVSQINREILEKLKKRLEK